MTQQVTYNDSPFATLRELDLRIEAIKNSIEEQKQLFSQARTDDKSAIVLALAELQRRLDLLNEFRAQSADQQRDFARSEVVAKQLELRDTRLDILSERISSMEGRFLGIAALGAILGILVAAYSLVK